MSYFTVRPRMYVGTAAGILEKEKEKYREIL